MSKNLTVLIPFRNESRTIPELVNRLVTLKRNVDFECVFIDDGSTDGSAKVLADVLCYATFTYKLISKPNGGKASAIREGIKEVSTSHVVILDADLELDPDDIKSLWAVVQQNQSEYVFGYRQFLSHSAFTYRYTMGNRFISNIYGIFFNQVITDIMCGLKLIPSELVRELNFKYKRFGIEIEIPIQMWRQELRPYEVPIKYSPRGWAEGKTIGVRDAIGIVLAIATSRAKLLLTRGKVV